MNALDLSPGASDRRMDAARRLFGPSLPARQAGALESWLAVAERGPVRRSDFHPSFFGRTLQFVALLEVLEEGDDYRHAIEGREVMRWFGKVGAERFSSLYAPDHLARLRSFYRTVQMTGRPNRKTFMVLSMDEEEITFSQLVLPAMDETGRVRFLAVVCDFPDPFRRIPSAPLRIYAPWWLLRKGTAKDTILGDYNWR